MTHFNPIEFMHIAPFIAIALLFFVLLAFDLITRRQQRKSMLWIAAAGMLMIAIGTIVFMKTLVQPQPVFGGLLQIDVLSLSMLALINIAGALTAVFSTNNPELLKRGEYSILLVASVLGLGLMTAANDLIMIYLSMEMAAIPLYVLAGYLIYDKLSTEAGLKYLLYGAAASTVMLFGFSWLYGFSGSTSLPDLATIESSGNLFPFILAFLFIMVGFGYKIAAVPFHFWAPDVYQGAPAPISGFLATASKTAGFVVLLRTMPLLNATMPKFSTSFLFAFAVVTMLAGNLLALRQHNIKRLLAYSSIAHAGYLLIGLVALTPESTTAMLYYLTGYLFANLAAFTLASIASRHTGSEEISSFSGLSRKNPGLALMFLIAFLSLAGIPPFAGFAGKFFVFLAAAQANLVWLVVIGVLNSVIALYYYLNVLKVIYARPEDENLTTIQLPSSIKIALVIALAAILYFGVAYLPWYDVLALAG
jgi:NADH-quinone oxidoreductase subunit N